MRHYRKTLRTYAKMNASDKNLTTCTLCHDFASAKERIISENDTMFVVANRVAYDIFEGQRVTDHLMVIPKRHAESIGDFTPEEMTDQMRVIGHYEKRGYSVYARGVASATRTVSHQHTHLIRCDDSRKFPRVLLFIRKPYVLFDW